MVRRRFVSWLAIVLVPSLIAAVCVADETREVKMESLTLKVPAAWKQQPAANRLRLGQFEIAAVEGDKEAAELTVSNFGTGGGVQANVLRWQGQFEEAERKVATTQGKYAGGAYYVVNLSGTYKKPIGPPIQGRTQPMPGARMVGVILTTEKDGLYFLKLTGPDKTVAAAASALRASFGGDEKNEKPYDAAKAE